MSIVVPLEGFGGGPGLNFKVVGGTSQPTNPRENTIWVNTDTSITSYVFSITQPTGSAGMVWFQIGTSSSVPFNALKKNTLRVYPTSCKQYVSGSWVAKTAKTYLNSKWTDWSTYLYDKGSSGWKVASSGSGWSNGTLSYNGALVLTLSSTTTCLAVTPNESVDLTDFKTLKVVVDSSSTNLSTTSNWIGVSSSNNFSWNPEAGGSKLPSSVVSSKTFAASGTITLDITSLNGKYYPIILATRQKTIKVTQVILEK